MGRVVVHIRFRNPGVSDTFSFSRTFGSKQAANQFITRSGYPLNPSEFRPSLYATTYVY